MMADKRIHLRSFPNVETQRLHARLQYLGTNLREMTRDESRDAFRAVVREIVNCERELAYRGEDVAMVTDGAHLLVHPSDVRVIRPYTRAETPYGTRQRA